MVCRACIPSYSQSLKRPASNAISPGVSTPRALSPRSMGDDAPRPRSSSQPPPAKSVQFNLGSRAGSDTSSPNRRHHPRRGKINGDHEADVDSDATLDGHNHHRQQHASVPTVGGPSTHQHHRNRRHHKHRSSDKHTRSRDPSPAGSDSTIDLPERFDEHGRPKDEHSTDPLVETIQGLFSGRGGAGDIFKNLTDGLLGGEKGEGSSSSRRRR